LHIFTNTLSLRKFNLIQVRENFNVYLFRKSYKGPFVALKLANNLSHSDLKATLSEALEKLLNPDRSPSLLLRHFDHSKELQHHLGPVQAY